MGRRGISFDPTGGWIGEAYAGVQFQMVFAAGWAIALAGVFVAYAG